jgi:hypothetical protein
MGVHPQRHGGVRVPVLVRHPPHGLPRRQGKACPRVSRTVEAQGAHAMLLRPPTEPPGSNEVVLVERATRTAREDPFGHLRAPNVDPSSVEVHILSAPGARRYGAPCRRGLQEQVGTAARALRRCLAAPTPRQRSRCPHSAFRTPHQLADPSGGVAVDGTIALEEVQDQVINACAHKQTGVLPRVRARVPDGRSSGWGATGVNTVQRERFARSCEGKGLSFYTTSLPRWPTRTAASTWIP